MLLGILVPVPESVSHVHALYTYSIDLISMLQIHINLLYISFMVSFLFLPLCGNLFVLSVKSNYKKFHTRFNLILHFQFVKLCIYEHII